MDEDFDLIQPTLIQQLKNILEQYPDNGQILKEIIQNAEDAGAREVRFLYDENNVETIFGQGIPKLQGPALYSYNDAYFRNEDWKGVRMFGQSLKENDPLKVGRFGLGFKSTFHLTDNPSIMSNQKLGILDPDEQLFSTQEERRTGKVLDLSQPGELHKSLAFHKDESDIFTDILGTDVNTGICKGSLFRFNFRTEPSKLSNTIYNGRKITELFDSFKSEGHLVLLFMKSLEKIEFYVRKKGLASAELLYSFSIAPADKLAIREETKKFKDAVKKTLTASDPLEKWLPYQTRISAKEFTGQTVTNEKVFDYSVIHYFAGNTLANEKSLTNSEIAKDLAVVPYVGIAYPNSKDLETGGHVFCTLPLPVLGNALTSLPVHVNGCFALGPDRKDLKWPSASQAECSDKQILWNQFLIQRVLPVAYEKLFCKMKSLHLPTEVIYGSFPDLSIVDGKWQKLAKAFFERIFALPCIWTKAQNGKWICPKDAWFEEKYLGPTIGADSAFECVIRGNINAARLTKHVELAFEKIYDISGNSKRKFIDQVKVRDVLKSDPSLTELLADKDRLELLCYVLSSPEDITELSGVSLLPLESGLFFAPKSYSPEIVYIPTSEHPKNLLPGLEGKMLKTDIDKRVISLLCKVAEEGRCQLAMLNEVNVPELLKAVVPCGGKSGRTTELSSVFHQTNTSEWLERVWRYALKFQLLSKLTGLPLIPLESTSGGESTIRCAEISTKSTLLYLDDSSYESVAEFMAYLGIEVVRQLPPYILDNAELRNIIFHSITPEGVRTLLLNMLHFKAADKLANEFRAYQNNAVKVEVRQLLRDDISLFRSEVPSLFRKLPFFENTVTKELSSVEEVSRIRPREMPKSSLRTMLLNCYDDASRRLAERLGAELLNKQELICSVIVPEIAEHKHEPRHVDDLMEYVLPDFASSSTYAEDIISSFRNISFIPAADGKRYRPSELYDPQDRDLQFLFSHEKTKFPIEMYKEEPYLGAIKKLGLKGVNDLSSKDVEESIICISNSSVGVEAQKKISVLLDLLERYPYLLTGKTVTLMRTTNWIPVMKERPADYPKNLRWHAEENLNQNFEKPDNMASEQNSRLLGAVKSVFSNQYATQMMRSLVFVLEPRLEDLVMQLLYVTTDYKDQCKPENILLLRDIYALLSKFDAPRVVEALQNLNFHHWIWNGEGFSAPDKIVVNPDSENLDLSPYARQMPTEMQMFQQMLLNFGAKEKCNNEMLIGILEEIKAKHDESSFTGISARKDLKLASEIVKRLSQGGLSKELRERLLVPIKANSSMLKLELADNTVYCHYSISDSTIDIDEDVNYLHEIIAEDIATSLGIRSVTSKMLGAEDLGLFEEYGQTEPLTRRINRILEDYGDGSAIIKELIQNADDAGATELKLLYDERQNKNQRNSLIDPGMRGFQGPALWAYNNANFSKEDFENITKLSGATKENQRDKVGKFGLGFNAVYNITDVPSFISQDQLVIFDPHTTNLDRAISNKSKPGVKINVGKNRSRLKPFKDQLMPYHDVFGVNMNLESNYKPYNGTLFRFPLRTQQQAIKSEIKKLCYDDNEMKQLLHKFILEANKMLIFTQNIREITIFCLSENSSSPNDMRELITARREISRELLPLVMNEHKHSHSEVMKLSALAVDKAQGDVSRYQAIRCSHIANITLDISAEGQMCFSDNSPPSGKVKWLIHSASDSINSSCLQMALRHSKLNPMSSVAIQVFDTKVPSIVSYTPLIERGNLGHFFCFLPLPIGNGFPVHINGTFALTHDRKAMQEISEDDKNSSTAEMGWNQELMAGPVATAYLGALEDLSGIIGEYNEAKWYKLWPTAERQAGSPSLYNQSLLRSFYQLLTKTKLNLFPSSQMPRWIDWGSILIIDNKLSDIAESIEQVIQCYEMHRSVVHLPRGIFMTIFEDAGLKKELDEVTVTFEIFFTEFFKPNIKDKNMPEYAREQIVLFLLRNLDEYPEIKDSLSSIECIPTLPSGKLKSPSQLVRPNSKASDLYEIDDEVFPQGDTVNQPEYLQKLESLGMVSNKISWELLEARARGVSFLQDQATATKRSRNLICLIEEQLENPDTLTPNNQNWRQIKFFPVKTSPFIRCRLPWGGNDYKEKFLSAEKIYPSSLEDLVGCHSPVIDEGQKGCGKLSRAVLDFFDIPAKPTISQICRQMDEVLRADVNKTTQKNESAQVKRIFQKIYEFLNKDLDKIGSRSFDEIKTWIQTNSFVLIENSLVRVNVVAFEHYYESGPYLYKLPNSLAREYQSLMSAMGVKKGFELEDYVLALECLEKDNRNVRLQDSKIKLVRNILESIRSFKTERKLYLPDTKGVLCPNRDICVKDAIWIPDEPNLNYIHHHIPPNLALALGARTVRSHSISTHSQGMPFGQHEKLTVRLKKILDGYPAKMQILLEILQNADDAGATKLQVILDGRCHPDKRVFSDAWKTVQGPAILFCNNAPFTESDLQGIQNLGEGSKSNDPLKTGQFGVGFNVVYHVTDVPSLLTYVEGKGSVLCVFDPHVRFLDGCTLSEPGRMFSDARNFLASNFPDVYDTFIPDVLTDSRSTVFRLPLRGAEMARKSKIKSTPISCNQMREMMKKFKNEVAENVIFLRNVESVELSEINNRGEKEIMYSICSQYSEDDKKSKANFNTEFESNVTLLKDNCRESVRQNFPNHGYRVTTQDSLKRSCSWHIIQKNASVNSQQLPESVNKQYEEGLLRIFPKGGIACKLEKNVCKEGRVFCLLPLQVSSSLPLHINGNFILDYETRRQLWYSKDSCFQNDWNRYIMEKCIVPCYIELLERFSEKLKINQRNESGVKMIRLTFPKPFNSFTYNADLTELHPEELQRYFSHFPILKNNGQGFAYDSDLIRMFYKYLDGCKAQLLPVLRIAEREENTAVIDFCPSNSHDKQFYVPCSLLSADSFTFNAKEIADICVLLLNAGIHIYNLPKDIVNSFEQSGVALREISPFDVRSHLRDNARDILSSSKPVSETIFKDVKTVEAVLKYCLKSRGIQKTDLEGLPLLVTEDQHLHIFTSNTEVYFEDLSTLFPNKKFMCLHPDFKKHLSPFNHPENALLRILTLHSLHKFLSEELDSKLSNNDELELVENSELGDLFPSKAWLGRLWGYLRRQYEQRKDSLQKQEIERQKLFSWTFTPVAVESFVQFLQPIHEWCFLPVERKSSDLRKPYRRYLIKIGLMRSVVRLSSRMSMIGDEIGLPRLSKAIVGVNAEYIEAALPNDADAPSFLEALYIEAKRETSGMYRLSSENAQKILEYFNDCQNFPMFVNFTMKLMSLPLYEDIAGLIHTLDYGKACYIVPRDLPSAGIHSLQNVVFLRENWRLSKLFKHLGFQSKDWAFAYEKYIFPSFHALKKEERLQHLIFLRPTLENATNSMTYDMTAHQLLNCLQNVAFVEKDGKLACANRFFDPEVEVFKLMLSDEDFPSSPFREPEWLPFLRNLGLKTSVSPAMFVDFARKISHEALEEEKTHKKSEALVKNLENSQDLPGHTVEEVSKINFVVPDPVPTMLGKICNKNIKRKFICFENAIVSSSKIQKLSWTVENVLPRYTRKNVYQTMTDLHVKTTLPYLSVARNLVNIVAESKLLRRLATGVQELTEEADVDNFEDVLLHSYEFLSADNVLHYPEALPILKDHAVISVSGRKMVIPEKTTLDERSQIVPYLFAVPSKYGKYFDFFQHIGTTKQPTCTQYSNVLREIYTSTQGKPLSPNELQAALKAVNGIYSCIENEESASCIDNLYLPGKISITDQTMQLFHSKSLVFVDDKHFEERLHGWKKPRIVSDHSGLAPGNLRKIVSNLPDKCKPIFLSEIISEKLLDTNAVPNREFADKLQSQLKCEDFVSCMTRLLKHQWKHCSEKEDELVEALEVIKRICVSTLEEVKTALYDSGEIIDGSTQTKDLFVNEEELSLRFYISAQQSGDFNGQNVSSVGRELSIFFRKYLIDASLTPLIGGLLSCRPVEMHSYLDKEGILRDTDVNSHCSAIYEIGEFVPVELHCLLVNDIVDIEKGEYVAYEAEDPGDENADGDAVYIYAKFEGKCGEECEYCLPRYFKIECAPGEFKHVHLSQLYKFARMEDITSALIPSSNTAASQDQEFINDKQLEEVMKEISEIIENAFTQENGAYASKIIKRLILRWHPDKNIGRESFCTKVFQHIQNEVERMKYRNYLDDRDWRGFSTRFYNRGAKFESQRRNFRQSDCHYNWSSGRDSQGFWRAKPGVRNPQYGEAKRWHRQAKSDHSAARVCLDGGRFDACCFMCHQAAEKGLKAVVYTIDANRSREHNLRIIALGIDDSCLKELASNLQDLLVGSTYLRYPNMWGYPNIPLTMYDQPKARQALEITNALMAAVENMVE